MSTEDEYHRNAAEAQRQADRAHNDRDRAAWLRLVQGWLSLLPQRPQSKGTGQGESKSSN